MPTCVAMPVLRCLGPFWCYSCASSHPGWGQAASVQLSRRLTGAGLGVQLGLAARHRQHIQPMDSATESRCRDWFAALPGCRTHPRTARLVGPAAGPLLTSCTAEAQDVSSIAHAKPDASLLR